jgi:hypothetical protein
VGNLIDSRFHISSSVKIIGKTNDKKKKIFYTHQEGRYGAHVKEQRLTDSLNLTGGCIYISCEGGMDTVTLGRQNTGTPPPGATGKERERETTTRS